MFTITYEDEIYRRWIDEHIFINFKDAKDYLIKNGFKEKSRLYERSNYNWSVYLKAYINPMKTYKNIVIEQEGNKWFM